MIFVIEEIDADGERKLCWQRGDEEAKQPQTPKPRPQKSNSKGDQKDMEEWARFDDDVQGAPQKRDRPGPAPLTLDTLLTALQGGCPAPGRLIVMTTNRLEKLDAALVRPGRLKKMPLRNLEFKTFKPMVMHYRPEQKLGFSRIPIQNLWTDAIDVMVRRSSIFSCFGVMMPYNALGRGS